MVNLPMNPIQECNELHERGFDISAPPSVRLGALRACRERRLHYGLPIVFKPMWSRDGRRHEASVALYDNEIARLEQHLRLFGDVAD